MDACVAGIEFGTFSGRALVGRVADGTELGSAMHEYRHGVMDSALPATGRPLPPDWALQGPEDHLDGNVGAHVTPSAGNALAPGQMTVIMGTSNCHVMNGSVLAEVPDMCGVVDGGIVAGSWDYEDEVMHQLRALRDRAIGQPVGAQP